MIGGAMLGTVVCVVVGGLSFAFGVWLGYGDGYSTGYQAGESLARRSHDVD